MRTALPTAGKFYAGSSDLRGIQMWIVLYQQGHELRIPKYLRHLCHT